MSYEVSQLRPGQSYRPGLVSAQLWIDSKKIGKNMDTTPKLERIQDAIDDFIEYSKKLNFCECIKNLRLIYGITRKTVQQDIGITEQQLFAFEMDGAAYKPEKKDVEALAAYYSVPFALLDQKAILQFRRYAQMA